MKTASIVTALILVIVAGSNLAESLICQTSLCAMHKNPEYDCRRHYLAVHIECGPNEQVCTKTSIFNTTARRTSVETRQQLLVSRSPLIYVTRRCDKINENIEVNTCVHIPSMSPPYDGYVCVCDTDFCNRGRHRGGMSVYLPAILTGLTCIFTRWFSCS